MYEGVIVLAGGTAARLGGVSKPDVVVAGRRMLDHVLESLPSGVVAVVVAPESVAVPDGVIRTLEDPPLGGPAAGIRAGFDALRPALGDDAVVAVVTCDAPLVGRALPVMADALAVGVRAVDTGHALPVLARMGDLGAVLDAVGDARDMSVRRLLRPLDPVAADVDPAWVEDLDDWDDVDRFERRNSQRSKCHKSRNYETTSIESLR